MESVAVPPSGITTFTTTVSPEVVEKGEKEAPLHVYELPGNIDTPESEQVTKPVARVDESLKYSCAMFPLLGYEYRVGADVPDRNRVAIAGAPRSTRARTSRHADIVDRDRTLRHSGIPCGVANESYHVGVEYDACCDSNDNQKQRGDDGADCGFSRKPLSLHA